MDYSIFDNKIDAVFVLDENRAIHYTNEAGATLVGVPLKRLKPGKKFLHEFLNFDDKDLFCMPNGTWGKESPSPWKELTYTNSSGQTGRTQMTIQPDPNSQEKRWLIFMHDVSLEETLHSKYREELSKKESVIEELRIAQAELEKYSKNLEIMVEQRTAELNEANKILNAMVNSLGQGFMVFDRTGRIHPTHSRAAQVFFETSPANRNIWDIIKMDESKKTNFKQWAQIIFDEFIPFGDLVKLGPREFTTSFGHHISLEYNPIRDENSKISGVVLVATDDTKEIEAKAQAEKERQYARMVIKLTKNKQHLFIFFRETKEILHFLKSQARGNSIDLAAVFRAVHTLKGGAATFNMSEVTQLAHEYEEKLAKVRDLSPEVQQAFRGEIQEMAAKLESAIRSFVESHSFLIGSDVFSDDRIVENSLKKLLSYSQQLEASKAPASLQENFIENFVKEPIISCFRHFDDLVQQTAELLKKKIQPIVFEGADLRVRTDRINELVSTLVHAFRNTVDHGIEPPEERAMIGKNPAGLITVIFERVVESSSSVLKISIEDDGRGIDPDLVRSKFTKKGRDVSALSDHDVLQLVFESGFSSRDQVTLTSGRGVGMDAIRDAAGKLGGRVEITSLKGQGTTLTIFVPEGSKKISKAA